MKHTFTLLTFLCLFSIQAKSSQKDCEQVLQNKKAKELQIFFNEAIGKHQIGKCELLIEVKNECINDQENFYVSTFITKNDKTAQFIFVINNETTNLDKIKIKPGYLKVYDELIGHEPTLYDNLSFNFTTDFEKVKMYYSQSYIDHSVNLERKYVHRFSCYGENPWAPLAHSGVTGENPSWLSHFLHIIFP